MKQSRNRVVRLGAIALALVLAILAVLELPVDVPDTNSPPEGNFVGEVNGTTSFGQTLVANRDGLNRVDVIVSTERPLDGAALAFDITEVPWKQAREVKRPLSSLPLGRTEDFRPGTIMQRWYSFTFEPIPDSAGKRFFFSLRSEDLPQANSAGVMMFFHNRYPLGEAYKNGDQIGANVVFRAYSRGRIGDLANVLMSNIIRDMPGLLGSPQTYVGLGLAYALLGAGVLLAARRVV